MASDGRYDVALVDVHMTGDGLALPSPRSAAIQNAN
jgi:hypothetical protein